MEDAHQSFNRLLGKYVFSTADKLIDSVDPVTQAKLIDLISQIDAAVVPPEPVQAPSEPSTLEQLTLDWQEVLNKRIDWESVHEQWLLGFFRERINRHRHHIAHLERAIGQLEESLLRAQDSFLHEPQQQRIIDWYDHTLDHYQHQLKSSQLSYESDLHRLQSIQNR